MSHLTLVVSNPMVQVTNDASFIKVLEDLLKLPCSPEGHVDKDQVSGKHPKPKFRKGVVVIDGTTYPYRIASDTKRDAIAVFLHDVGRGCKITVAVGPQGGIKIGVDGKPLECFQVYLTDEKQKADWKIRSKTKKVRAAS